jgi:YD repeat-containing protein
MFLKLCHLAAWSLCGFGGLTAVAQTADNTVRVTVAVNPDRSKTVYQTSGANHQTIATMTGADGKGRGKIIYKLDDAGRYQSGQVFATNGDLRFKTLYAYDTTGRLTQERQLAKDDSVRNRIVYCYDTDGHQTGYAIYDGAGLLIGRTTAQNDATGRSPLRPPP